MYPEFDQYLMSIQSVYLQTVFNVYIAYAPLREKTNIMAST